MEKMGYKSLSINDFCKQFDRVFCISLARSIDRRDYIKNYFSELGIKDYEFFDATDSTDEVVDQYYKEGLVMTYPPCFRCGKYDCGSDYCNNVLIAPQIATFITYLRLWHKISESEIKNALIVEDDVIFTDYASEIAGAIVANKTLDKLGFFQDKPVLLRLGWGLSKDHKLNKFLSIFPFRKFRFKQNIRKMSNPCHAINLSMAKFLIDNFNEINTTVDVYQHRIMGAKVDNYTLLPPLSYELSWSLGAVDSLIHPKRKRIAYLKENNPIEDQKIQSAEKAVENHIKHILYRPLLVIGHPRCGSDYMSKLLKAVGLDVGHEQMGKAGIASWMFAVTDDKNPYGQDKYSLSRKFSYFQFIIHHVCNPIDAIPSIMIENKNDLKSYEFRRKHIKLTYNLDLDAYSSEIEKAILSYIYWNRLIEEAGNNLLIRVEDEEEKIIRFLLSKNLIDKTALSLELAPKNIDSNKPYGDLSYEKPLLNNRDWNTVDTNIMQMLNQQCISYGYDEIAFDLSVDS